MKKETNTKTPERILISVDENLSKHNEKTLQEIFSEIDKLKSHLLSLDLPFTKETFAKCLNEGTDFIAETLYQKLAENYEKMSEKVIQTLIEGEKVKLQKLVIPIEPILLKIQELLNQIQLRGEQVPFDAEHNPIINSELKNFLSEKSKRYAEGDEIPIYNAVIKFITAVNEIEQFLAKTQYPLLIGIPGVYLNKFLENNFFNSLPYFMIDTDNCDDKGYCELQINPELFEEFRENVKRNSEREKIETELRSVPPEVRFTGNRIDIPAASFKLKPTAGIEVEGKINTSKTRWKGMPGVQ